MCGANWQQQKRYRVIHDLNDPIHKSKCTLDLKGENKELRDTERALMPFLMNTMCEGQEKLPLVLNYCCSLKCLHCPHIKPAFGPDTNLCSRFCIRCSFLKSCTTDSNETITMPNNIIIDCNFCFKHSNQRILKYFKYFIDSLPPSLPMQQVSRERGNVMTSENKKSTLFY